MNRIIKKISIIFVVIFLLLSTKIYSQESQTLGFDTLNNKIEQLQTDFGLLKKLKISGYVQAQYQIADSAGASSFAGGNFPAGIDKRYQVRRGRLKFNYATSLSNFVVQFDITENQFKTKDAYFSFTEPLFKTLSLQAGIFDRPFGFEIHYSSSVRESPERSRLFQTVFPDERDLGAMITFKLPKKSPLSFITVQGGLFNGIGPSATDFDKYKDFIGQIYLKKSYLKDKLRARIGASYYNGGFANGTKYVYSDIYTTSDEIKAYSLDSTASNKGGRNKREDIGFDAQITYDSPIGLTELRGEYVMGSQPTSSSTSSSPKAALTSDTYIRNFNGYYFYFVQNIAKTKHQLVFKYDVYDPNTDVTGSEIGVTTTNKELSNIKKQIATTKADIKYSTIGLGWIYHWDSNIKVMAYYDMVTNETTKSGQYNKDQKDNVFTLRVQYKF